MLDSLAKNVGTPYTLYLGHNLYDTFMNAYVLVDSLIRKKLDEMLKTWKEPVPGSLDTRPVFPLEKSRQIENALIKARTNALARQQVQARPMQTPPHQFRNTPLQGQPVFRPPSQAPNPSLANGNGQYYGTTPVYLFNMLGKTEELANHPQQIQQIPQYSQQVPLSPFQTSQPQAAPYQPPPPSVDLYALRSDLTTKIREHQSFVDANPYNQEIRTKLKTLQDLESHLATKTLGSAQLQAVQEVVSKLPPLPQSYPQATPQTLHFPPQANTAPVPPTYTTPQPAAALPSATPLISNQLAEFLRQTASRQQPTPPPIKPALPYSLSSISTPPLNNVTPVPAPSPATAASENPILAQLRASGLLAPTGTPPSSLPNLPQTRAPVGRPSDPSNQNHVHVHIDIKFTPASIRLSRPHLVRSLFDVRPNRCNTCGRRFTTDAAGKEKKARHLDWHFKTNTRLADAQKRGQSRSWYVDERDWIANREYEDDEGAQDETTDAATNGLSPRSAAAKTAKKEAFVKVPADPTLRNLPCPICQEKFDSTWSDQEQEFIWRDAIKIGQKIYHDSCYREVAKDREKGVGGTPKVGVQRTSRTSTPDSVLGKRKAEGDGDTPKSKLKT